MFVFKQILLMYLFISVLINWFNKEVKVNLVSFDDKPKLLFVLIL